MATIQNQSKATEQRKDSPLTIQDLGESKSNQNKQRQNKRSRSKGSLNNYLNEQDKFRNSQNMSKQENIRQLSNSSSPKKKKKFLYQTNDNYQANYGIQHNKKSSQVLAAGSKCSQDSNSKSSAASTSHYIQTTANNQNKNHLAKKLVINPSNSNIQISNVSKLQQSPTNLINNDKMIHMIGKYKNKVNTKNKLNNEIVGKQLQFSSTQDQLSLKNLKIKVNENQTIGQAEQNCLQPKQFNEFLISQSQTTKNQNLQTLFSSQNNSQKLNLQNIIKQLHQQANKDQAKENSPQSSIRLRKKKSDKMLKIQKIYKQENDNKTQNSRQSKLEEERVRSLSPQHQYLQKQLILNQQKILEMGSKDNKLQVLKQNQIIQSPKSMSRQRSQKILQKYTSDNSNACPIKSNFSQLLNQFSNAQNSQRLSKISSQRGNKQKFQFQTQSDIQYDQNAILMPQQSAKGPERKQVANFKVGRNSSLTKKEQSIFSNSKKLTSSIKKKGRPSSQHRNVKSFKEENNLTNQQQLDQILLLREQKQMTDFGSDVQHSFVKEKRETINKNVRQYSNILNHIIENNINKESDNEDSNEEFQSLVQRILNDQNIFEEKTQGKVKELIQDCLNFQNDQIQKLQCEKQTQQNISPSAYEILKSDNESLSKELQTTIDKLKLAKDFAQSYKKEKDQYQKKSKELEQMLEMFQDAVEKEMEGCYTEQDVKKFGRELNVLYEQNQELHKLNKRMKEELKLATEREKQFIKIIKKSPDLVSILDMEDSSFLDEQIEKRNPQEQEKVIVSSKQVPINKIDLEKVKDIQKLQAQGLLAPIEDSQIIDKKQIRQDVQNLLLQENSEEDESLSMDDQNDSNSYGIEEAYSKQQNRVEIAQSNNDESDSFNDRENQQ